MTKRRDGISERDLSLPRLPKPPKRPAFRAIPQLSAEEPAEAQKRRQPVEPILGKPNGLNDGLLPPPPDAVPTGKPTKLVRLPDERVHIGWWLTAKLSGALLFTGVPVAIVFRLSFWSNVPLGLLFIALVYCEYRAHDAPSVS